VHHHSLWKSVSIAKWERTLDQREIENVVVRHAHAIEILKLCNARQIGLESLSRIASGLTQLKEVHFCDVPAVVDDLVDGIARRCRNLKEIYLGGCNQLTDSAFVHFKGLSLSIVSLRGCSRLTSNVIRYLPQTCIEINLSGCSQINFSNFDLDFLENLKNLQKLNLHAVQANDELLKNLSMKCLKLEQLILSSSNPFADNFITDLGLINLKELKKLQDLNVMGCRLITDEGISKFSEGSFQLQRLCLGFCSSITDRGIVSISKNLTNISHLSIFRCHEIGDDAIYALSQNLTNLVHLDITACERITSTSIEYFIKYFPLLEFLNIGLCRNISNEFIQRLRSSRSFTIKHY
jgi:F-box/leucine-rich repeat protein 2/20